MIMLTVYGDILSGNCYKVKWVLHALAIPHQWHHIDILAGGTQTASFLALNPNGKVPLLVIDQDSVLWESNAIINYLAEGSALLPSTPFARAQVLQWQFFEQYSHEPFIAVARYIKTFLNLPDSKRSEYEAKQAGGHKALKLMNSHLEKHDFFVNNQLSLADISLFAYTHVAPEGGFDLEPYPFIRRWLERISNRPEHLAMKAEHAFI